LATFSEIICCIVRNLVSTTNICGVKKTAPHSTPTRIYHLKEPRDTFSSGDLFWRSLLAISSGDLFWRQFRLFLFSSTSFYTYFLF
jgi:hypothetical protein